MNRDYEALLHQTGASPAPSHALTIAHPHPHMDGRALAPAHPVVHDARAIAQEVMSHLQPHLAPAPAHHAPPQHPHAPYYPHPSHAFEHEPPPHGRHARERERERERERDYEEERPHRKVRHTTHAEKVRTFPIGFVQTGIAPGVVAEIEVKPQVRFQGKRLAVAPSISRYFDIVDIKVGKDSQLAATGALAAESLSALAVDVRVELDPAPPGIVITMLVQNNDTAVQDFRAILYGLVEETED